MFLNGCLGLNSLVGVGLNSGSVSRWSSIQQLVINGWHFPPQSSTGLDDFERLKTLGTGSFGRVMLVKHRGTEQYYAMKILDKQKVGECLKLHTACFLHRPLQDVLGNAH